MVATYKAKVKLTFAAMLENLEDEMTRKSTGPSPSYYEPVYGI